ncbi:hypothetical protein N4T77_10220 [Clostridium sp. CX1]|uniref:Uncharacterized protein n=1 Tax=Clostridium tanneri TaxID=3037988 RepID=A0ABU4JYQ7_9CLOT|nr:MULTISPECIES: hypothetical protein [unclassified Clostridium]MCT8976979.1 hypothetical protein [Clostridium sp. CX1]MDW8803046.1 hypothetical protein [Clostridium sp. A1-XYC3]
MKYYTSELWRKLNSDSDEEREDAKKQWTKNSKEYGERFEKLKYKLPKRFLQIFMKEYGFHDYYLTDLQIIHETPGYRNPVKVILTITDTEKSWNIIYHGIKDIDVKYTSEPYVRPGKTKKYYDGFDIYGYNEFNEVDEETLSHEILFASGATILVSFRKISIKKVE